MFLHEFCNIFQNSCQTAILLEMNSVEDISQRISEIFIYLFFRTSIIDYICLKMISKGQTWPCHLFLQIAPPLMFDRVQNTPLKGVSKTMTQWQSIPVSWTKTNIADRTTIIIIESILEVNSFCKISSLYYFIFELKHTIWYH